MTDVVTSQATSLSDFLVVSESEWMTNTSLESKCLKVFFAQSGREYWINQTYKTRDVKVEFIYVLHKLLIELGKFFEYFLMMLETFN
jgi:hypothetical protein